jgi:hypothetical protein
MKTSFISLLIMVFTNSLFSQNERINCIIFVDGKLPTGIFDTHFSYIDNSGTTIIIDFDFMIGEIQLTSDNKKILDLLRPETEIKMAFSYKNYKGQICDYSGTIKAAFLNYDYLVIRITNLDKKTCDYYFGYSTPGEIKKFIKKEYNMFEDF